MCTKCSVKIFENIQEHTTYYFKYINQYVFNIIRVNICISVVRKNIVNENYIIQIANLIFE